MGYSTGKKFQGLMIIASLFILTSCAKDVIPVEFNCPEVKLPTDPIVPINKLTDTSTPDEVMKAWVATAVAYRNWDKTVRQQFDA